MKMTLIPFLKNSLISYIFLVHVSNIHTALKNNTDVLQGVEKKVLKNEVTCLLPLSH